MNILVIGQNGREHVLAESYAKSKRVTKVVMTPGNGLTDYTNKKIKNYPEIGMMNFEGIIEVCKKEKIDIVDVAQDDVIAAGYVDKLKSLRIKVFGPTQKASQLEWDKDWARNFMVKYNLPIPGFKSFTDQRKALAYVKFLPEQVLYVKASGLALGKGALRAQNKEEAAGAIAAMTQFGKAGETFLIEECLVGEEFSLFAICCEETYVVAKASQDHKTINEGDQGPNTGGIGSVAPTGVMTKSIQKEIEEKIIKPILLGMKKERRSYRGILYIGGMLTETGVKIIEINARWGDPEAEVILPSIKTDYLKIVEAVINGKLKDLTVEFDNKIRLSIAGCSRGYPGDYSSVKGKEIYGLKDAMKQPNISIFGAGIKRESDRFFVSAGRIFHLVAQGQNIIQARSRAYAAMANISIEGNNLHYRSDIGWRDVARLKK